MDLKIATEVDVASLLPYPQLIDEIESVSTELARGEISCPDRMVLPLPCNAHMLVMAATSYQFSVVKAVTVCPANRNKGQAVISGEVVLFRSDTGERICLLPAAIVTSRRTAALSLAGTRRLYRGSPQVIKIIGTGTQAFAHVCAFAETYLGASILIQGRNREASNAFINRLPAIYRSRTTVDPGMKADLIICVTTSREPVVHGSGTPDTLVIAVGAFTREMAELAPDLVNSSVVYVDTMNGACSEAGDLIQAEVDWDRVRTLADAIASAPDFSVPRVFKTVGCAGWDLAAGRVAARTLAGN